MCVFVKYHPTCRLAHYIGGQSRDCGGPARLKPTQCDVMQHAIVCGACGAGERTHEHRCTHARGHVQLARWWRPVSMCPHTCGDFALAAARPAPARRRDMDWNPLHPETPQIERGGAHGAPTERPKPSHTSANKRTRVKFIPAQNMIESASFPPHRARRGPRYAPDGPTESTIVRSRGQPGDLGGPGAWAVSKPPATVSSRTPHKLTWCSSSAHCAHTSIAHSCGGSSRVGGAARRGGRCGSPGSAAGSPLDESLEVLGHSPEAVRGRGRAE